MNALVRENKQNTHKIPIPPLSKIISRRRNGACLLAVYNGEWRGGTAMTVRYARKLGRKIIILNPV